jgi:hypothetical protein
MENKKKELLKTSIKNCLYVNMLFLPPLFLIFAYQYFIYDISFNSVLKQLAHIFIYLNLTLVLIFAFVWGDNINGRQAFLIGLLAFVAIGCVEIYINLGG